MQLGDFLQAKFDPEKLLKHITRTGLLTSLLRVRRSLDADKLHVARSPNLLPVFIHNLAVAKESHSGVSLVVSHISTATCGALWRERPLTDPTPRIGSIISISCYIRKPLHHTVTAKSKPNATTNKTRLEYPTISPLPDRRSSSGKTQQKSTTSPRSN